MRLLDVAEVPVLEVVVMLAMVNPFLEHVTQHDTAQKRRRGIPWKKDQAYRNSDREDWQQISYPAVDVRAVEGTFMVSEVSGLEVPVGQVSKILFDRPF